MRKPTFKITCQYCKKPFESAVFWARYCSNSHRQMAYEKRRREQHKRNEKGGK